MRFSLGIITTVTLFLFVGVSAFQVVEQLSLANELQRLNREGLRQSVLLNDLLENPHSFSAEGVQNLRRVVNQLRSQVVDCGEISGGFFLPIPGLKVARDLCQQELNAISPETLVKTNDQVGPDLALLKRARKLSATLASNSKYLESSAALVLNQVRNTLIPLLLIMFLICMLFVGFVFGEFTRAVRVAVRCLGVQRGSEEPVLGAKTLFPELADLESVLKAQLKEDSINERITENLADLLDLQTSALKRSLTELQQFSYRASHDLRSPLTTSVQLLDLIVEDLDDGDLPESRKNIGRVQDQLRKLDATVKDLMVLARADLLDTYIEEVNFPEMVEETKERLRYLEGFKEVEIITSCTTETLRIQRPRLSQLLDNLIINSIKYRSSDVDRCWVRVELEEQGKNWLLVVTDNGIGIPKEQQEKAFEPFVRFSGDGSTGSGLGLSIVRKHVNHMSGKIRFDTGVISGTKIVISLPRNQQMGT